MPTQAKAVGVTINQAGGGGDMRQDGDTLTMELPGPDVKRGRGRPRKPDALTPAQRAQRYRDRQRAAAAARKLAADLHRRMRVRYRGPNGETWSGRGKTPIWVRYAVLCGHTLASMDQWAS